MVAFFTLVAHMLVALFAEVHARPVRNVDALAAPVVGATAIPVPAILLAFVAAERFR